MLTALAGGTLFGQAHGQGRRRVLALHGWRRSSSDFDRVLDGLVVDGAQVASLALDLPGFGATPAPTTGWGSADYAAALLPVLDELGGPVVVLGHSFGGRVAVHLAAAHPERVSALVLTGVPLLRAPTTKDWRWEATKLAGRLHLIRAAAMQARWDARASADYKASTGVVREVFKRVVVESYAEQLAALRCPVRMVWGQDDTAAPVTMARQAAALVPGGADLTVLAGVDHMTPLHAPDALRAAVAASLA